MRMFLLCLALSLVHPIDAFAVDRSTTERYRYVQTNPCPVNGKKDYVKCPGYNLNHTVPLCIDKTGDVAANMVWMKIDAKKLRDRIEHAQCACLKSAHKAVCPSIDWKGKP